MFDFAAIDRYLEENLPDSLEELKKLVAQPSVAAQGLGLAEAAHLVTAMLESRGFASVIMNTGGHPVVFAERKGVSDKTILIYNHYDVQPAEPLELWTSPPFQPEERDGKLYGRGISDDKGHLVSRLFAIDSLLNELGELPCNVKFIIEGEEEIGSVHLPDFVDSHQELLQADACIWEFGGVDHREVPMQYLGLRGICYVELTVETAEMDIHSGLGGSIFPNPAWRLIWALNTLKDQQEHIRLPGFYDPIIPPTDREIELLAALPPISQEYKDRYGIDHFLKDYPDETALRVAAVYEPTCTICGLTSGYQGPGSKTVLPARASAKVDFRLVLGQTPAQVLKQLREHLDREGFQDIHITGLGGGPAARTDPDDPFVKLVVDTSKDAFGEEMQLVPMVGGSGPNYAFVHTLKLPVVTTGIGYPGGNAHAPDENIRIDLYLKGAKHIARILQAFGQS
ncbi:MAG TPA: M20/M25/M40 family metallo-hydrolase [Chloroflexi bacterium]|nr:MAG: peptidase M20 [Chloroflexota bacterium]HDN04512.1 M20/M25/M40 family metallo-hydrolase [Chloroflexota bacterium]